MTLYFVTISFQPVIDIFIILFDVCIHLFDYELHNDCKTSYVSVDLDRMRSSRPYRPEDLKIQTTGPLHWTQWTLRFEQLTFKLNPVNANEETDLCIQYNPLQEQACSQKLHFSRTMPLTARNQKL